MAETAPEKPSSADPMIGRRVGSYVVEQLLGAGGMGSVYRGVQPAIGKRVAIKFLAAHLNAIPDVVARFFDEAKAVNLIGHENIVDIFDFGKTPDGQNYFVMELLEGPSLEREIAAGKVFSAARAVEVARQIASALSAAHARSIIHRDLKPENVFLLKRSGRDDFVKILDFGIAKLQHGEAGGPNDGRTKSGMVLGTPGYMAPEQASGDQIDCRADVYSLGVVLFRMIAGQLPFAASTHTAALLRQLTETARRLDEVRSDLPPGLVELVARMLSRTPQDRPSSMAEVEAELAVLAQHPLSRSVAWQRNTTAAMAATLEGSTPAEEVAVDARPSRRSGPPVVAIFLIAGAAVGIGALALYTLRQPSAGPGAGPVDALLQRAAITQAPPPTQTPLPTLAGAAAEVPPTVDGGTPPEATFALRVESTPPGAEITDGEHLLGITPTTLTLEAATSLVIKLPGYRDVRVEAHRGDDILRVQLRKAGGPPPPKLPRLKPKGGISLDD